MENAQQETTVNVVNQAPKDDQVTSGGNLIAIDSESQQLAPANHAQLARFIDTMITAKALPRHLTNREQVMSAWNYAAELGLPPQPSLRNIAVIEGSPSLFGDLPLALVQRHKDFLFYEEFNIDEHAHAMCIKNDNLRSKAWGGVVRLQRAGMKDPQEFVFTLDDANRAGLIAKAKGGMPWLSYPQIMLIRRARIMAIRALFADAITGAAIAEDYGIAPDLKDVTPPESKADVLKSAFKRGKQ